MLTRAVTPTYRVVVIWLVALTSLIGSVLVVVARARGVNSGGEPMARIALHDGSIWDSR